MPRKAKKKQYFTQETEDAIIRYNEQKNPAIRNRIYNEHIRAPFEKLAENIIHTFKFYYFDVPSEDVKHEVVSFLVLNMNKFKDYPAEQIARKLKQVEEFEAKYGSNNMTRAWYKWCVDRNYRKKEWEFRQASVNLFKYNNRIL